MPKEKKIVFGLLCLACVTISFNVAAIAAIIPVISKDLDLPPLVIAKMIPYYMIPYGIGALLYAPLTKIISYRRILSVSMVVFSFACFTCARFTRIDHILFSRILMGVSGASVIPLGLMIIGEFFEKSIRGRLVGVFFGCSFFASLVGLALSGVADWRWIFVVPAGLGMVLAILCYLVPLKILRKVHGVDVNYFQIFQVAKARNIFIYISVISALYHGVHKWFGMFFDQVYGLDKLKISGLFILAAIFGFCGQMAGGVLSDKKGRLFSSYLGIIGLTIAVFFLSLEYTFLLSCVSTVLISFFWTMGHNGTSTVLTDFPDPQRPMIASLNSSLRFLSGGIGFYLSSFFVERSFGTTFFVISILMFLLSFTLKKVIDEN